MRNVTVCFSAISELGVMGIVGNISLRFLGIVSVGIIGFTLTGEIFVRGVNMACPWAATSTGPAADDPSFPRG